LHFMIMSIIHSFMRIYHLKHVKHDHEINVTFQLFFVVSVHSMLDSCVTNVWYG